MNKDELGLSCFVVRASRSHPSAKCRILLEAVVLVLVATGCGSIPANSPNSSLYHGNSLHRNIAKSGSNFDGAYKEHPTRRGSSKSEVLFQFEASDYLEAVDSDLEAIQESAKNALDKINAAESAVRSDVPYVGGVLYAGRRKTNFKSFRGYPLFPDFDYNRPKRPAYGGELEMEFYKIQLLDFAATVKSYIEDGNQFIRNCESDFETISKQRASFVLYLDLLHSSGAKLK